MGCAKILLYIFNSIFLLLGGACLGIGIWVKVDNNSLLQLTRIAQDHTDLSSLDIPSFIEGAAWGLIAGGGSVLFVSVLGCCGAIKDIKGCLYLYAGIVGIILVAEIVVVALAAIYFNTFETYAKDFLKSALDSKYDGPYKHTDVISLAFDSVFVLLSCCGVNNYTDLIDNTKWNRTSPFSAQPAKIPLTCCQFDDTGSFPTEMQTFIESISNQQCPVTGEDSYEDTGCYDAIKDVITKYSYASIGTGAGIVLLEILAIICACVVARDKKGY